MRALLAALVALVYGLNQLMPANGIKFDAVLEEVDERCAWTAKVPVEEEYECCRDLEQTDELKVGVRTMYDFETEMNTTNHKLACLDEVLKNLRHKKRKFPMICCKIAGANSICDSLHNNQDKLDEKAKEDFERYEKELHQNANKTACPYLDPICCRPRPYDQHGLLAPVATRRRAHRRDQNGVGAVIHELALNVLGCIEALIMHTSTFRLDLPDVCCSLPIIHFFCPKTNRPTPRPKPPKSKPTKKPVPSPAPAQTPEPTTSAPTSNPEVQTTSAPTSEPEVQTTSVPTSKPAAQSTSASRAATFGESNSEESNR